jgi:hypothetical protein
MTQTAARTLAFPVEKDRNPRQFPASPLPGGAQDLPNGATLGAPCAALECDLTSRSQIPDETRRAPFADRVFPRRLAIRRCVAERANSPPW